MQLTKWQSDTLFGSLCWAYRYRHGELKLQDFLTPFNQGAPPFLLSDVFPSGYYPLPLASKFQDIPHSLSVDEYQRLKELKKTKYISESICESVYNDKPFVIERSLHDLFVTESQMHASINRISGTTTSSDDAGMSLFQLTGDVPGRKDQTFRLLMPRQRVFKVATLLK